METLKYDTFREQEKYNITYERQFYQNVRCFIFSDFNIDVVLLFMLQSKINITRITRR